MTSGYVRWEHAAGAALAAARRTGVRQKVWRDGPRSWRSAPVPPPVVVLCGSSRFEREIRAIGEREALKGNVVLGAWSFVPAERLTAEILQGLERAHIQMMHMADEVMVVAPGGYIGRGTRREMEWGERCGKRVTIVHMPRIGA